MKRITLLASATLLLISALPAHAVNWGEPDNEDHPHVVTLLFLQGESLGSCTGTLLTPWVVLTAGHCTEAAGEANPATWVRNDPDIDALIEADLGPGGAYEGDVAGWLNDTWTFGFAVPHPQYDDYAEFPDTFDIGLVLLTAPIDVPVYGSMPAPGQFDFLATKRGKLSDRQAVIVGYGLQGRIPPFAGDDWVRYRGLSAVTNLNNGHGVMGSQNMQFTNNPGQGSGSGGTCSGDSGGPAFWIDPETGEETTTVMAVNSYSITPQCNGTDYQFRTDIPEAQDFVNALIDWPDL